MNVKEWKQNAPAVDVIDLLCGSAIKDLLAVNGFTENGSHYDLFSKICLSADRDRQAIAIRAAEGMLSALLGETVQLSSKTCADLWHRVADLLLHDPSAACKQDFCREEPFFSPPSDLFIQATDCVELSSLCQFTCQTWQEREARAMQELQAACSNGVYPRLSFSRSFSPVKPNLYRVERILAGEETNEDLWKTQLAYLLFRFCEANGIRPVIATECAPEKVVELLKIIEKLTPLCNFIWQTNREALSVLPQLCRLVMNSRRSDAEGDPSVLITIE